MAIECLTRRHTPYGLLSETACDWIEAKQILRWTGDVWVYLKRTITSGVNKFTDKGKRLPTKETETCYNSMLLDFAIKRLSETPSMEDMAESALVEHIVTTGIKLEDYEAGLERKYHMSKLSAEEVQF